MILISKLGGKNKIKAINSWAVAILRYGTGVLEWRVDELKELDSKTRKLLTILKGLHSKRDVDRLYVSRKAGGRALMGFESTIRSEVNKFASRSTHAGILKFRKSVSKKRETNV